MSALHVDSVIKSFGRTQILTDVFISCKVGEVIGLLGRNGTGKSTLLKIIFGSLHAERDFVRVDGKLMRSLMARRNRVHYLPQDSFLPKHLKVKKIITLFCDKNKARKVQSNPQIFPLLDRKSRQLSGGEKRLLEVLLMVHSNAKYILIDEPFNGISPLLKEEIKSLINEHKSEKAFIVTDHDYRNILDVSTRIILLRDGGTREIKQKEELAYWGYLKEVLQD